MKRELILKELAQKKTELEAMRYEVAKQIWQIEYKLSLINEKIKKYGLERDLGIHKALEELEKNRSCDLCRGDIDSNYGELQRSSRSNTDLP